MRGICDYGNTETAGSYNQNENFRNQQSGGCYHIGVFNFSHAHNILHASSNTHETWTSVSYDLDVSLVLKEGSKNKKEYLQKKREGRTNPKVVNKCDNFLLPFILFSFNYTDS